MRVKKIKISFYHFQPSKMFKSKFLVLVMYEWEVMEEREISRLAKFFFFGGGG